ncbi:adenylate/guanylate cyclase domain-containing protein [Alteromonas sp. S015]|uniref:adenylate/guanylate cyclase domain-containing protein n=1 Tax=Alteromonas sp. S015 TaxID=3117401 RepID=UPI002FE4230B
MDLRNINNTTSSLREHHNVLMSPRSLGVESSVLTPDGSAVGFKSCIKKAVVIFCDLSCFQYLSIKYGDIMCARLVDTLFFEFDELAADLSLSPLKTNGDQYIAVSFSSDNSHDTHSLLNALQNTIEFALRARELVNSNALLASSSSQLRVGIATGHVVAGQSVRSVKGYDIWGTTVNRAAMLEQYTAPDTIAICERSYRLVKRYRIRAACTRGNSLFSIIGHTRRSTGLKAETDSAPLRHDKQDTTESNTLYEYKAEYTFHPKQLRTKTNEVSAYVC